MGADALAPEALFERLVAHFGHDPAVAPPSEGGGRFGATGLKVDGRIFAMLARGELVVKLPRSRVAELIASGTGKLFDPGHGRVMKEWITIAARHGRLWRKLAQEARLFVAGVVS